MFSVSLTHSVSHGYDFVHILAYAWEIKLFTENVIKKTEYLYVKYVHVSFVTGGGGNFSEQNFFGIRNKT